MTQPDPDMTLLSASDDARDRRFGDLLRTEAIESMAHQVEVERAMSARISMIDMVSATVIAGVSFATGYEVWKRVQGAGPGRKRRKKKGRRRSR